MSPPPSIPFIADTESVSYTSKLFSDLRSIKAGIHLHQKPFRATIHRAIILTTTITLPDANHLMDRAGIR